MIEGYEVLKKIDTLPTYVQRKTPWEITMYFSFIDYIGI